MAVARLAEWPGRGHPKTLKPLGSGPVAPSQGGNLFQSSVPPALPCIVRLLMSHVVRSSEPVSRRVVDLLCIPTSIM